MRETNQRPAVGVRKQTFLNFVGCSGENSDPGPKAQRAFPTTATSVGGPQDLEPLGAAQAAEAAVAAEAEAGRWASGERVESTGSGFFFF